MLTDYVLVFNDDITDYRDPRWGYIGPCWPEGPSIFSKEVLLHYLANPSRNAGCNAASQARGHRVLGDQAILRSALNKRLF